MMGVGPQRPPYPMKLYFHPDNDTSAAAKLMVCGDENTKDTAYLSLPDVAERLARGERLWVPDPFSSQVHELRGCVRQTVTEPADVLFLVACVRGKETRRGGMAGSGGAFRHLLPRLGTENVLCVAVRRGVYRWRRATDTIRNVAVLNRQGAVAFAHVEHRSYAPLSGKGRDFCYCLSVADDAPCVLFDGCIRLILADKAPETPRDERPLGYGGTRRFYLLPELQDAPLKHLIRMARVPLEGGGDAEARARFLSCFEHLAAKGNFFVGSAPPAAAENVFYAVAPWQRAALAEDAAGNCLAYAWDGTDARHLNSLLLLAAWRRGEAILCADLPRFLNLRHRAIGFSPRRDGGSPLPLAAALRDLLTAQAPERVRVLSTEGRLSAPDIWVEAADGSTRTRLVHRRGEAAGEFVWELRQTRPATGETIYCRRLSSLSAAPAYRALARGWMQRARAYAEQYVNKQLIATAETESDMVCACLLFNSRFYRPHADDCPLLRTLAEEVLHDAMLQEEEQWQE